MNLVIISPEKNEIVKELVEKHFSKIKNLNLHKKKIEQTIFDKENLGKIYKVFTKGGHHLSLMFQIESPKIYFKKRPISFITYLINNKGKGSLTSFLREKLWAFSVSGTLSEIGSEYCLYEIKVNK